MSGDIQGDRAYVGTRYAFLKNPILILFYFLYFGIYLQQLTLSPSFCANIWLVHGDLLVEAQKSIKAQALWSDTMSQVSGKKLWVDCASFSLQCNGNE